MFNVYYTYAYTKSVIKLLIQYYFNGNNFFFIRIPIAW